METNKRNFVRHILGLLPDIDIDEETALVSWYQNIRNSGGLRLSPLGYQAFMTAGIEHWSVSFGGAVRHLSVPTLMGMDKKMKYPYYLDFKKKQIVTFSSREAMLATLYGDLQKFLENYN